MAYSSTEKVINVCGDGATLADIAAAVGGHVLLDGVIHTDSLAGTVVRGDLIVGNSTPKWSRFAKGTAGTFLKQGANDPAWTAVAVGDFALATGSLVVGAASVGSALAVGTAGQILLCNATPIPAWTTVGGVITIGATGTTAFVAGAIVNADINTAAAIAVSKIALAEGSLMVGNNGGVGVALVAKTSGRILIGDGTTAVLCAISGDVALASGGGTTVTDFTISGETEGDILYRNATNWVRLAKPVGAGYYLEGGTAPSWSLVTAGTASAIQSGATLQDAGANDAVITFTTQGTAGASVVVPNFAGATANTFAFINFAQTWSANQTFNQTTLLLKGGDANTLNIKVNEILTGAKTLNIEPNDTDRTIHLHGNISLDGTLTLLAAWTQTGAHTVGITTTGATAITLPTTGTLATLGGTETLAAKTLTAPKIVTTGFIADGGGDEFLLFVESATPVNYIEIQNSDASASPVIRGNGSDAAVGLLLYGKGTGKVTIADSTTPTKMLNFELVGATATKTMTITSAHTDDRALTLPDATDTLVGKATADVFTNKSLDCDGTGNVLTNVNVTELDPIGDAACGVPVVYQKSVANLAAAGTNICGATNPKMRIIDAWFVATSADTGTIAIHAGQVGSVGASIVTAFAIPADDMQVTHCDEIDDAAWDLAANTGLVAVGDGGASIDGVVFVKCIRVD